MEKNEKDKKLDETKVYKVKSNSKKSKSGKKDKKTSCNRSFCCNIF